MRLLTSKCAEERRCCVGINQCCTKRTVIHLNPILDGKVVGTLVTKYRRMEHNILMGNCSLRQHTVTHTEIHVGITCTGMRLLLDDFVNHFLNGTVITSSCTELRERNVVTVGELYLLFNDSLCVTDIDSQSLFLQHVVTDLAEDKNHRNLVQSYFVHVVGHSTMKHSVFVKTWFELVILEMESREPFPVTCRNVRNMFDTPILLFL